MKARLEAVIYAAEEPVTLQQLATLFAEEAFAWSAAREAASEPGDASAARELDDPGTETGAEPSELLPAPEPSPDPEPTEAAPEPSGASQLPPAAKENSADPALEAKRAERKREREVREILREVLDELIAEYAQDGRGIEIREIAGGFRMGTKPEMHDSVRAFVKSLKPPLKLSLPALETLAVIAYKQPVTAPEVSEIRGVDSAGVLGSLMSRKLISTAGRKQVIGRPMLYKTTREFLVRFGLKDVGELPSMEEFEKMAAIEMSEDGSEEEAAPDAPIEQSGDLFADAEPAAASAPGSKEPQAAAPAPLREATNPEPVAEPPHAELLAATPIQSADMQKAPGQPESESIPEADQIEVEL